MSMHVPVVVLLLIAVVAAQWNNNNYGGSSDPCRQTLVNDVVQFKEVASLGMRQKQDVDWTIKSPSMTRQCLEQVAFQPNNAGKTIDALKSLLDLYVFLDVNKDSGPPFNLRNDVSRDLDDLRANGQFETDYDFHTKLRSIFAQARDGHLRYTPPRGFANFHVIQPLKLNIDRTGNEMKFYVDKDLSYGLHDYAYGRQDLLMYLYRGWEVLKIDGKDPMDFFNDAMDKSPFSKDDSINFNFHLLHWMNYRNAELPEEDFIRFRVRKGTEEVDLEVGYLVLHPSSSSASIEDLNRKPLTQNVCGRMKRDANMTMADLDKYTHAGSHWSNYFRSKSNAFAALHMTSKKRFATSFQSEDYDVLIKDELSGFTLSSVGDDVLVLSLPSFVPPIDRSNFWFEPLQFIIEHGHLFSKLLIDISDNVGGMVCSGVQLAHLVTGRKHQSLEWHDVRKTPLYDRYVPMMPISLQPGGQVQALSNIYFGQGEKYTRGGVQGSYTGKFVMDCNVFLESLENVKFPFAPEDIAVISNGVSVSTASVFLKAVKDVVKTVGVGGLADQPMSMSFSIGNPVVFDSASLDGIFACAGDFRSFPRLPTSAVFAFPFSESYEWSDAEKVAEFVRDDPMHRLDIWKDAGDPRIYEAAIDEVWKGKD